MTAPSQTIDALGVNRAASCIAFAAHGAYAVIGMDLNDLSILALRLEAGITDPVELGEWRVRLNAILQEAKASSLTETL